MLYFGVPLENSFPAEEMHYGIKNFLFEAYTRILSDNISVQDVLSKFQGSIEERLMLKNRLILGRNINKLKIAPGSLLWVVRHFIGLLPNPLLSDEDYNGDYLWIKIAKICKSSVSSYVTKGRYNTDLVKLIAKKLSKLPQQSFVLIVNLFDYMRMLAVLPEGENRINKVSAFALVEYFSSSLFLRPFHPGSTDKIAKQYYPLTLFLILKWTEVKNYCIQFRQITSDVNARKKIANILVTKRQFVRRSTAHYNVDPNLSDEISFDANCDYLQDVACQTEDIRSKLQENCFKKCCCGMLKTNEEKHESDTKIIYIKQKCCCTYGTNYESMLPSEQFSNLEEDQIGMSDLPISVLECKRKLSTASVSGAETETDDFFSKTPYDKIQHFDPIEKKTTDNSVKNKIAKVGWSYTCNNNFPKENFDELGTKYESIIKSPSNTAWNRNSEDCDSFENMRKSLNTELNEKFAQNEKEERKSEEYSDRTSSSKLSLPKVWGSISKESRNSVNKIKQKLNILKAFSDKKISSKKSVVCKREESKIKYQRVGSENSLDMC